MRSTILLLLASCMAIVSAIDFERNGARSSASNSCDCYKSVASCISSVDRSDHIAFGNCFHEAGCTITEELIRSCTEHGNADWAAAELRRRADTESSSATSTTEAKTTSTKTTSAKTTSATTTSQSSSASASTTSESSTSASTTSTSQSSSSTTTTGTTTSTTSTSQSSTSSGTATSLTCYITHTISTTACASTTSGQLSSSCSSTTVASASCAPGIICFDSVDGVDVCMKRDDTLTTSGLVVTIAFGVGVGVALLVAAVMHIRGRQKAKREQQVAAMMKGAEVTRDMERSAVPSTQRYNQSEDNLPLITPAVGRQDYLGGTSQDREETRRTAPRLHQGLGALE